MGDVRCGIIAKELAEGFFVIGNAVLFDQRNEISGSEARQCGFSEVGIRGEKIFWCGVNVGEIAAAAAGDEYFLAGAVRKFDDSHAAAAFGRFDGAEEAGRASAEDENVEGTGQRGLTIESDGERRVSPASLG
jgi:hypothetical protein